MRVSLGSIFHRFYRQLPCVVWLSGSILAEWVYFGAGVTDEGGTSGPAGFRLAKPGLRYAGGGFAKAKPEREHSQEDYVELLRVAEVLEALNAVEGAVLQVSTVGCTPHSLDLRSPFPMKNLHFL